MNRKKSKKEFKKKVVMWTGVLFVCACLVALVFAWNEKPTDVFTYIIPTAGGVFAAAVVWYLKAVQLENGIKIQLGMIKKLIDLGEENQAEETNERIIQKMKDKTYWVYFFILLIIGALTVYAVLRFLKLTPGKQIEKVKAALLYMVTEAEREFKSKTGRIKRSMVWEWLVERFPIVTLFLTEEQYDELLNKALEEFRKMLENNKELYNYVYGTDAITKEEEKTTESTVTGA